MVNYYVFFKSRYSKKHLFFLIKVFQCNENKRKSYLLCPPQILFAYCVLHGCARSINNRNNTFVPIIRVEESRHPLYLYGIPSYFVHVQLFFLCRVCSFGNLA